MSTSYTSTQGQTSSQKSKSEMAEEGNVAFDTLDHSLLQQPLNLGIRNVHQILKCIQGGSHEVKDIILNECNIIYECKVCCNLFRSLANFLAHKRFYCTKHCCENMVLFSENVPETSTVVIQPEAPADDTNVNNEEEQQMDIILDSEVADSAVVKDSVNIDSKADLSSESITNVQCSTMKQNTNEIQDNEKPVIHDAEEMNVDVNVNNTSKDVEIIICKDPKSVLPKEKQIEQKVNIVPNSDKQSYSISPEKRFYDNCIEQLELKKASKKETVIQLKPIDGNQNAMIQIMEKRKNPIKEAVNAELNVDILGSKLPENEVIVVIPEKIPEKISEKDKTMKEKAHEPIPKRSGVHLTREKRLLARNDCNVQLLKCLKCNTQYTTQKTLYFHMISIHAQKRLYYPCPFCKHSFVQMWGVTRHLMSVHRKTKEQVNKMRDAIRKCAIFKRVDNASKLEGAKASEKENKSSDAQKRPSNKSTEKKQIQTSSFGTFIKIGSGFSLHQCTKCHRIFGRKSSQVSHEKFCIMNTLKSENLESSPPRLLQPSAIVSLVPSSPPKLSPKLPSADIKVNVRPKRGAEKQMHKDFVNSQTLKWRSANKVETGSSNVSKKQSLMNNEKKVLGIVNANKLLCLKCKRKFSTFANLRRHAAIHIGWTRFKCKHCPSQFYNKSECKNHIQRMHAVSDMANIEKCIVNLTSDNTSPKKIGTQQSKAVNSQKLSGDTEKVSASNNSKNPSVKANTNNSNKSQIIFKTKTVNSGKAASPVKRPSAENKREKISPTQARKASSPENKKLSSYKSLLTTNNPTTIILSKKLQCSPQTSKNNASASITNSENSIISENSVSTRLSLRKPQKSIDSLTTLVTRSGTYPKANLLQAKESLPPGNTVTEEVKKMDNILQIPERTYSRKDRPISDWFPKKITPSDTNVKGIIGTNLPRRDSAPLIIGLVAASSGDSNFSVRTKSAIVQSANGKKNIS